MMYRYKVSTSDTDKMRAMKKAVEVNNGKAGPTTAERVRCHNPHASLGTGMIVPG
jgi:hypothetical protein